MSRESKALQKSCEIFMRGVDPSNVVAPLFTRGLLTPEERQNATQPTRTDNDKLEAIYTALLRCVSANSEDFYTLVEILRQHHKGVADRMEGT